MSTEDSFKNDDNIRMFDENKDSNLKLYSYIHCDNKSKDFHKQTRGIILQDGKVVLQSFPYTDQFNTDTFDKTLFNSKNQRYFSSYEGTLLRMYFVDQKWFLSTHKKLSAFDSRWGSRESFGDLFKNALEREEKDNKDYNHLVSKSEYTDCLQKFQSILDKNCQYMFLLTNDSNTRKVSFKNKPSKIYHVGTFSGNTLYLDEDIGLPKPKEHKFQDVTQLMDYVKNINIDEEQGIIAYHLDSKKQWKLMNSHYHHLETVRGNSPNILLRLLEVFSDYKLKKELYDLYPSMIPSFLKYGKTLQKLVKDSHSAYVRRFIYKQYVVVPSHEYFIIKLFHNHFLEDRTNHKITYQKAFQLILTIQPYYLLQVLNKRLLH